MEHYAILPFHQTKLIALPADKTGLETTSNTPVLEVPVAFLMIKVWSMDAPHAAEDVHTITQDTQIILTAPPCAVDITGRHEQRSHLG